MRDHISWHKRQRVHIIFTLYHFECENKQFEISKIRTQIKANCPRPPSHRSHAHTQTPNNLKINYRFEKWFTWTALRPGPAYCIYYDRNVRSPELTSHRCEQSISRLAHTHFKVQIEIMWKLVIRGCCSIMDGDAQYPNNNNKIITIGRRFDYMYIVCLLSSFAHQTNSAVNSKRRKGEINSA